METNHHNLWKEAYKKYHSTFNCTICINLIRVFFNKYKENFSLGMGIYNFLLCVELFTGRWNPAEQREQSNITASSSDVAVIKDVITRMYGCPIVQLQDSCVLSVTAGSTPEPHCNLLTALFAVETASCLITIHEQTAKYSLQE